jgi:alkyldihydroxyacetonephosphate synthase
MQLMTDLGVALETLTASQADLEVLTDGDAPVACAHDWWMRGLIERRQGKERRAGAVLRPASTEQVAAVLAWAQETRTAVVPYGLGSGVCGAVAAERDQVVLDMGKMSSLLDVNDLSLTATVQPGMRGSDYENALNERGYTMGHFPQSIELSTVGGWCATRAAGQLSTLYGNIEDMLLGCEVVLAGGRIIRLPAMPRSSTGPDLRQLFLGSEGTLGVFTELVFRVHARAEATWSRCFAMPSLAAGIAALRLTLRAGWRPAVTRLYDATEAGRNFQVASEGQPVLLLMSEGPRGRIDAESLAVGQIVAAQGGVDKGSEPVETWLENRNHVPSFEDLLDSGLVVDTIEIAIGWERVEPLWDRVVLEGSAVPGMLAMSGHVSHSYTQGANIYFTFVAQQSALDEALSIYDAVWELTMKATHEMGGTIAHHHGIGRVRKKWLSRELDTAHCLLSSIKNTLDPLGIMNPGALIDSP